MSDDVIDSMMRRLDRVEAVLGSFREPVDRGDELKALRAELATVKHELKTLPGRADIAALRAELAKMHPTVNVHRDINAGLEAATDIIIDDINKTEKTLRGEFSDVVRTFQRDVERAETAASAAVKHAGAILTHFSEELGS